MRGSRTWMFLALLWTNSSLAHETAAPNAVQVAMTVKAEASGAAVLTFRLEHAARPLSSCRCRILVYAGTPSARVAPLIDTLVPPLLAGETHLPLEDLRSGPYTVVLDGRPSVYGSFDAFRWRAGLTLPHINPAH